ncbi:MAG: nucleotidyltransferase [Dorea sp.]|jgi:cytidyltransferase-like protein|nr:nucleotidyltransferase [Dorea sp.]
MKIVGLITEYNPFHNGHLYHIRKAKEITKADAVIVVMSGDFVQRGAPAIMPKHIRAEVALEAGVPLILELPVCFSTGSAEYFATGAVSLLEHLRCVDSICFGSECGDYDILEKIACVVLNEPEEYKTFLKRFLAQGISFPLARQWALLEYFHDENIRKVLEQPNNILGIEYIKALRRTKSSMKAYTIKRIVSGYHDDSLHSGYSSASAIRKLLAHAGHSLCLEGNESKDLGMFDEPSLSEVLFRLEREVPKECIHFLEDTHQIRYPVYSNDFSALLGYKLLTETKESLSEYLDITDELANRILNHANHLITIDQFCNLLKTKDMTYSRISRCLFHILLDIKKDHMESYKSAGYCQYARVLGFRKDGLKILSLIKKYSDTPLITKLSHADSLSETAQRMIAGDIFAANLYERIVTEKYREPFINEYTQRVVMIK